MPKSIYITLPIQNLEQSKSFYTSLGMKFNPDYSDDKTVCMVWEENIMFMITEKSEFSTFLHGKSVANTKEVCGSLQSFQFNSRKEVDEMASKAVSAGGSAEKYSPNPDYDSWMYIFRVQDLDGNQFEFLYMDLEKMAKAFTA
jgi:uncharacterized protein